MPEVVTLNGQLVEFVVGTNTPLPLGVTFVQANGAARQDVFYKHIGSIMRITPRRRQQGQTQRWIWPGTVSSRKKVNNWNRLAEWISDERNLIINREFKNKLPRYTNNVVPIPTAIKEEKLTALEQYPAQELRQRIWTTDSQAGDDSILRVASGEACDWKPEDCTIDLEIVLRESRLESDRVSEATNAISNIVQVKSGHGIVMGGLLASREVESISKIPVLVIYQRRFFLSFQSCGTRENRTDLDGRSRSPAARQRSRNQATHAEDFQLAQSYVIGELLDSPLQTGMYLRGL